MRNTFSNIAFFFISFPKDAFFMVYSRIMCLVRINFFISHKSAKSTSVSNAIQRKKIAIQPVNGSFSCASPARCFLLNCLVIRCNLGTSSHRRTFATNQYLANNNNRHAWLGEQSAPESISHWWGENTSSQKSFIHFAESKYTLTKATIERKATRYTQALCFVTLENWLLQLGIVL